MKITEAHGNEIIAEFVQPDTYGFNIFRDGDSIEVCNP